jgi:RND family efflux transporter MFP subunit
MTVPDDDLPAAAPKRSKVARYLIFAAIAFGALAAYGIVDRNRSDAKLASWTDQQAVPSVDLVSPKPATEDQHLTLPANIAAFYTAPIHSRVNGYVRMWYFDIGARVKTGDVLARIDTPDLDQQYEQAKGELSKAQADYNLAVLTADRWKSLRSSQAVSQQTADEKAGDALARKAEVTAAQANVDRVKALTGFKDITAPFDGIITARRIDVGALVSATNNEKPALFDVASMKQVRVYVRVPQVYTASMHKGLKVVLRLPQYPGRDFVGALDTTANFISADARSLLVEALFQNPDELLTPGAYAQAKFDLPLDPKKLTIPSSAIVFRNKSPEVAVVANGKVTLKPVSILVDTGSQIELAYGLDMSDKIVASPSDSIEQGDVVNVSKIDGKAVEPKLADAAPLPRHEAAE